jgi:hypothetical protein
MFGSITAKYDTSRLRVAAVTLAVILILVAIGIAIAFTASPHLVADLGCGTAWADS